MSHPTDEQWQWAGERGEKAVRKALAPLGIKLTKARHATRLEVAAAHGALVAIGGYLRALAGDNARVTEQWALAIVRGAIRGAEQPVHDDGRPFVQASDA